MAKTYKFTPADVPAARRGTSQYSQIIADFIAQEAESMLVELEGVKPTTLRSGLRSAIKTEGADQVRLVQRGEETFLAKKVAGVAP